MDPQDTKDGWTKLDNTCVTLKKKKKKKRIAVFNYYIFGYNEGESDRKQIVFPTTLETTPVILIWVKDQAKTLKI